MKAFQDAQNSSEAAACPRAASDTLRTQVKDFQQDILLEDYRNHVALVFYDDYIKLLRNAGNQQEVAVANFLQERMDKETTDVSQQ